MKFLNFFFLSKIFERLNNFLAKKIFKIFKVFFVETNLSKLPITNYPLNDLEEELIYSKKFATDNNLPYMSYSHLPHLLELIYEREEKLNFFDYGGGNLNLYFYLNKKFKKICYYFKDQNKVEEKVKDIIRNDGLENLFVNNNNIESYIDILYFGSSLQYVENYKEELSLFFKKTKYILIAQSPFFQNKNLDEKIILKQINMHPNINYLYLFNLDNFINFMDKNGYELVEKNINKVTKFLNFKNFNRQKYKNINMYDLLFKFKNEIK